MLVFTSDPALNLYIRLHGSLFEYIGKINYIKRRNIYMIRYNPGKITLSNALQLMGIFLLGDPPLYKMKRLTLEVIFV